MTINVLFDIWHAAVADFNCVSVEYFMQWTVL